MTAPWGVMGGERVVDRWMDGWMDGSWAARRRHGAGVEVTTAAGNRWHTATTAATAVADQVQLMVVVVVLRLVATIVDCT